MTNFCLTELDMKVWGDVERGEKEGKRQRHPKEEAVCTWRARREGGMQ